MGNMWCLFLDFEKTYDTPSENKMMPLNCSSSVALEQLLSCIEFHSHSLVVTRAASELQFLTNY